MKNAKKLISLALTLAMIVAIFSIVPILSASADAGDVFTVTNLPDNWKWYTSSYVTRTSGSKFTLGASTNKGNGLDNYGILACDAQSRDIIKASTAYKIKFRIETWFTPSQLEVNIDTGTALWSRKNSVQRFTDLASRTSNTTGGGSSKLYTDLTFTVITPADITGNQHFVIGIIPQSGNVGNTANLAFKDITITELGSYNVVDADSGKTVGTVYGLEDDDVYELVEKFGCTSDVDYTYASSPTTVSALTDTITLTRTLKENIVQKIDFGSDAYIGNSNDTNGHYYSKVAGNKRLIKQETSIKGEGVNVGADFGNRAIVLANDRFNSGLVAGNTYRVTLKFTSWSALSNFGLQVKYGRGVWNTISAGAATYTGTDFTDLVTTLRSPTNEQSGNYMITLDVTLPEIADWGGEAYRNIIVSLYGTGANTVDYWLATAHIYSKSTATVTSSDGNYTANINGFEGDLIGSAISDNGAAKFLNIADRFSFENTIVLGETIIFRGDANADFKIDSDDFALLLNYIFEKPEAEGADLFGLNVVYDAGNEDIDICDLVALEMKLESISIP